MSAIEFENVKGLLLEMAQQHSVDVVLQLATTALGRMPGIALVRVWLIQPGDVCSTCKDSSSCADRTQCLHLMASYGRSRVDDSTWMHTDGFFSRFPIGVRKVGEIAKSGRPVEVVDVDFGSSWLADSQWAKREGIRSFGGQPLVFRGQVLGVLSVFTRCQLERGELDLLRMIADHLAHSIANVRAFEEIRSLKKQIELENAYLREEVNEAHAFKGIIGESEAISKIRQLVQMVGPTDANVLIYGESGTGKEMIAREIHNHSARSAKPMIKINCSSVPKELFESEFFGHVRGAFTGAVKNRVGHFQAADGGTLFLDEIGEIPVHLQGKLLRVLQEGEYQRIGDDVMRKVDVRIVSATNRNLQQEIKAGRFREDLYYRLQVFPLEVPPLRVRKDDIALLANHFMKISSNKLNKPLVQLTDTQLKDLESYDWPGNIRELQNFIERTVITSSFNHVDLVLPKSIMSTIPAEQKGPLADQKKCVFSDDDLRNLEKENIQEAVRRANWKIYGPRGAAEILGIKPTTLISRLKKMGIYKQA